VVDVTESPINRPKKNQKEYYSGKKQHTLKTQVIIERSSRQIIDIQEAKGCEPDFKVLKYIKIPLEKTSVTPFHLTLILDTWEQNNTMQTVSFR
jgi:hypothetical protein